jgi:hypothetical protein
MTITSGLGGHGIEGVAMPKRTVRLIVSLIAGWICFFGVIVVVSAKKGDVAVAVACAIHVAIGVAVMFAFLRRQFSRRTLPIT